MQRREFLQNGLLIGSAALLLKIGHSMPVEDSIGQLFQAIIDGRADVVEALIRDGVDVNGKGFNGNTALHFATTFGSPEMPIAKLLVENGADVNAKNNDGTPPIYAAATWGNVESIRFLVEHGADADVVDEFLLTPLVCAMASENKQVIEYLAGLSNSAASL